MSTRPLAGLREVLHSPGPVYSAILTIPDPGVAAILGWSGFHYVVIDAEHAPLTLESMRACVDALAPSPAASVIRVAANDPTHLKQALDVGADGVQVPSVRDAAGAAAAVSASRYSPDGTRGVGLGHAARYGANVEDYLASANARLAVLAMIEDAQGVENAAEIAAVDGLDGVVIGPFDLSADLGVMGKIDHPTVQTAFDRVIEACVAAGTKVGTLGEVSALARRGVTLFTCFIDGIALGASARQAVADAEAAWADR
ncbi:MAG: HpcH/HpaI aldolase family protein [Solirubrobacteraceae bacterium]